jgi:hypothetical protein
MMAILALLHGGAPWVFYVGMGLGALLAGAVVTRQSPVTSYMEPAIGGLLAVITLLLGGAASVRGFDLGSDHGLPWLMFIALALGAATLTGVGAWFANSDRPPGFLSVLGVAMFVTMGLAMVVGLLAVWLAIELHGGGLVLFVVVFGILGGLVSQLIVARKARLGCALGFPGVIAVEILANLVSGRSVKGELILGGIVMIVPGLVGALIGWRVKPKRTSDVLAAFD